MRRGITRTEWNPNPRRTRKAFGKLSWTGRALALAVLGAVTARPAPAQGPNNAPAPMPASAPLSDAMGPPPPPPPPAPCAACATAPIEVGVEPGNHFPCEIYVRGGIASPMGGGIINSRMDTGWAVQAGLEQKVSCPNPWIDVLVDFGAGYLEAGGKGDQIPVVTPGTLVAPAAPLNTMPFTSSDFFFTRLGRFRRTDLHTALDSHFFLPYLNPAGQRRVSLDFRAGVRVASIGISYGQTPTPTLQAEINTLIQPSATGAPGLDPSRFVFLSRAEKRDYAFGEFASLGASWTYEDVRYGWFALGTITGGVEVEFSHDWVNAGLFTNGKKSVWMVSPMLTLGWAF